jgi:hypothetical protein
MTWLSEILAEASNSAPHSLLAHGVVLPSTTPRGLKGNGLPYVKVEAGPLSGFHRPQ